MTGMPRGHVVAFGVGAVAVFGCLVGCTSGGDERPPPSATSSGGTPTTSTSAVPPPTLPASATADQQGAEVFVRYFWDTYNHAYATGDTKPFMAISESTCVFCKDVAARIDSLTSQGGHLTGGEVSIDEPLVPPGVERGAVVTVVLSQNASTSVSAEGQILATADGAERRVAEVGVIHRPGGWRVLAVDIKGRDH